MLRHKTRLKTSTGQSNNEAKFTNKINKGMALSAVHDVEETDLCERSGRYGGDPKVANIVGARQIVKDNKNTFLPLS